MYTKGDCVAQDYKKALEWYTKAAEQGDAEAQYNLGVIYEEGLGIEKDMQKAKHFFKQAAKNKFQPAMIKLAEMKTYGDIGVNINFRKARSNLKQAHETAVGDNLSPEFKEYAQQSLKKSTEAFLRAQRCSYGQCPTNELYAAAKSMDDVVDLPNLQSCGGCRKAFYCSVSGEMYV